MNACFNIFSRCTLLALVFLLSNCREKEDRKVQRSFYYWRTVFNLSPKEKETVQQLGVKTLYVKFFDVEWNNEAGQSQPVAKSIFSQQPPDSMTITPVVFLTQAPLQHSSPAQLDSLAANISRLLASITANNHLRLTNEVQLDCDWTAQTRENYFYLLQQLRRQPFFQNKILSATIRLHQVKFISETGIPPADRGLLMCYNMGNLRQPQAHNSIIDEKVLRQYIASLDRYALPLDIALPLFDWYILFEGNHYKGLLRDFSPGKELATKTQIHFTKDTVISGYTFKAGQWLRHERSDASTIKACAELVSKKLPAKELTVILYHLDQHHLDQYSLHELESFYNSLR